MAKIKHIALSTQDPDKTAKFCIDVFGLKQVGRVDSPGASGYYLTDGDINVAILKFKTDAAAGTERGRDRGAGRRSSLSSRLWNVGSR